MSHRPRKDCTVPGNLGTRNWTCPDCGTVWRYAANAGSGADLWHGNDNVRLPNGQKPKTTILSWLFE
jgi:hypothetical protein